MSTTLSATMRYTGLVGTAQELEWHWVEKVDSTMEEAKRLLLARGGTCGPLAVGAARQVEGRGTRGRRWQDGEGNVMLTIAIDASRLPLSPMTLLPLRVGTIVHDVLARHAPSCKMTLKWPNDILLDGGKLAGTLVELADEFVLIGIGVNLAVAPDVPADGPDMGRHAVSLQMANCGAHNAQSLARQIADALSAWAMGPVDHNVVADWSARADWTKPLTVRDTDRPVRPLRLLPDGRLQVRPEDGGPDMTLVAEYLI